jgi:hypothetical protein
VKKILEPPRVLHWICGTYQEPNHLHQDWRVFETRERVHPSGSYWLPKMMGANSILSTSE